MGRKEVDHDSRRKFLQQAGYTAFAIFLASQLPTRLLLNEEQLGYFEEIDEETKSQLLQFNPVTIAHRGGNSLDNLNKSMGAGVDFVEADIRSKGNLIAVAHERYWGPFAYDRKRRFLRLGDPSFLINDLVRLAKSRGQNILFDFQNIPQDHAGKIADVILESGLASQSTFCGDWGMLDKLSKIFNNNSNFFYTIKNAHSLTEFINQQQQRQARGVSLDASLASEEALALLRQIGISVFVYGIHDSKKALRVLELGAGGLISNNLDILKVWNNNT